MPAFRAYRAATPYNGSELAELNFEQTTDTLYLAHIDHEPAKLVRNDHDDWVHSDVTFGPSLAAPGSVSAVATQGNTVVSGDEYFAQPATYVVTALNDETGQESRASSGSTATNDLTLKKNYNTITWASVTGADRYNVYKSNNDQFYGYIGTTEGTTFRDDNIGPALDQAPPAAENPFASTDNFPSTVALHDQRLLWARTRNVPNGIWGSRVGVNQLENMDRSRPARADDAFSTAIVAQKVNPVNHLVSGASLLAFTNHAIFRIDGNGQGGPIVGNSPPSAIPEVRRGSTRLRPLPIDNVVIHPASIGYAIRALGYNFELDGNRSNDISIFSPHFFMGYDIVDWDYASEPRSIVWMVRSDGKLLAFTWEQEQNVWGFTLCETDGLYKSVCVITENGEDRTYFIVERTIGGVTKRFVERMASHLWDEVEDACWLDSSISGTFENPVSGVSGLWHLEGETVSAQVDGAAYSGLTVTNGAVSFPSGVTGTKITVGLPYTVEVETLPIRVTFDGMGSNLGRRQQPGDVVLHLQKTANILAGTDSSNLFGVRQTLGLTGDTLGLLDGVTDTISMSNKSGNDITVLVRQELPSPFTMLGIGVEPEINE